MFFEIMFEILVFEFNHNSRQFVLADISSCHTSKKRNNRLISA